MSGCMLLPACAGACVLVLVLAIEKRNVRKTQECLGGLPVEPSEQKTHVGNGTETSKRSPGSSYNPRVTQTQNPQPIKLSLGQTLTTPPIENDLRDTMQRIRHNIQVMNVYIYIIQFRCCFGDPITPSAYRPFFFVSDRIRNLNGIHNNLRMS